MNIVELENDLKQLQQIELETNHLFADGVYTRELIIPKGAVLIGKRHRYATTNILLKGKMTIYDEHSSFTVEAPFMAVAEPLTKKMGYAHEDSIWVNIHPTNETDLDIIEKQFIIEENEYLQLQGKDSECLG